VSRRPLEKTPFYKSWGRRIFTCRSNVDAGGLHPHWPPGGGGAAGTTRTTPVAGRSRATRCALAPRGHQTLCGPCLPWPAVPHVPHYPRGGPCWPLPEGGKHPVPQRNPRCPVPFPSPCGRTNPQQRAILKSLGASVLTRTRRLRKPTSGPECGTPAGVLRDAANCKHGIAEGWPLQGSGVALVIDL